MNLTGTDLESVRRGARAWGLTALLLGAGWLTSCGSSSSGPGSGETCSMATACGGNIAGSWRVTSSCLTLNTTMGGVDTCPTATLKGSLTVSGSASFNSDSTYNLTLNGTGTETIGFPASCLTRNGVLVTCDQLNQGFAATPLDAPFTSIHCTTAGQGGCDCVLQVAAEFTAEVGTFSTSGSVLTKTAGGGAPKDTGYCVKGNKLDLLPTAAEAMEVGTGHLTFTRQ